eukprot:CAMPEP_0201506660 /NCGR_PEP_ID=MMETSP0161_2-20130828/551_1 /ASSEMBLY_ACC=CAM_ASM_000251 /TAXON_ID=180227 /ORGANISM="Neoparamoeba aestuarina, Strain SoJaBio B1-5/56/2" /LENGTH=759 /DNA_ID=CAMNT_0047900823 /DNA_START=625 /DNA_END=2901 /DNA_ORIENTATION=-
MKELGGGDDSSFTSRYKHLFQNVTGVNPRRDDPPSPKENKSAKGGWQSWEDQYPCVRIAQRDTLRLMIEGPKFLEESEKEKEKQQKTKVEERDSEESDEEEAKKEKEREKGKETENGFDSFGEDEDEEEESNEDAETDLFGGVWSLKEKNYRLRLPLSPTLLSAAVGEIPISKGKSKYVVVLGLYTPEFEKVLKKPSRDKKDDLFDISSELRKELIAIAREGTWPFHSNYLPCEVPGKNKQVTYCKHKKKWCVGGIEWDTLRKNYEVSFNVHSATPSMKHALAEFSFPEFIHLSLWERYRDGIVEGCWVAIRSIIKHILEKMERKGQRILLRSYAIIRRQWTSVRLPIPGLDGGKGSDELMCYVFDKWVYQFLLILSVWVPGALTPSRSVPHFDVPQPDLLRCVKVLLAREIEEMSTASPSSSSSPSSSPFLSIKPPENLLTHQRDTVDDLHKKDQLALERDGFPRRSHFFCLATGAGKTRVAITYILEFLQKDLFASSVVDAVVWLSPLAAIDDIVAEIRKSGVKNVCKMPATGVPKSGYFNVVKDNVIAKFAQSTAEDSLCVAASRCFFVFDEVDRCYNLTQRTSAALECAENCFKSVCMTATPLRSNTQQPLYQWINLGVPSFPLAANGNNGLPLACDMIKKNVDIGIKVTTKLHRFPLEKQYLSQYKDLCNSSGKNLFNLLANVSYQAIDKMMVKIAREVGEKDGGCLLVVRDAEHALRLASRFGTPSVTTDGTVYEAKTGIRVVPYNACRGFNW